MASSPLLRFALFLPLLLPVPRLRLLLPLLVSPLRLLSLPSSS